MRLPGACMHAGLHATARGAAEQHSLFGVYIHPAPLILHVKCQRTKNKSRGEKTKIVNAKEPKRTRTKQRRLLQLQLLLLLQQQSRRMHSRGGFTLGSTEAAAKPNKSSCNSYTAHKVLPDKHEAADADVDAAAAAAALLVVQPPRVLVLSIGC